MGIWKPYSGIMQLKMLENGPCLSPCSLELFGVQLKLNIFEDSFAKKQESIRLQLFGSHQPCSCKPCSHKAAAHLLALGKLPAVTSKKTPNIKTINNLMSVGSQVVLFAGLWVAWPEVPFPAGSPRGTRSWRGQTYCDLGQTARLTTHKEHSWGKFYTHRTFMAESSLQQDDSMKPKDRQLLLRTPAASAVCSPFQSLAPTCQSHVLQKPRFLSC